jgi:hypothetical protein
MATRDYRCYISLFLLCKFYYSLNSDQTISYIVNTHAAAGLRPVSFNTYQFGTDYKSAQALNDHYLFSSYFLNIPLSNGVHKHAFRFAFLRPLFAQVLQVKNKPYFPFAS